MRQSIREPPCLPRRSPSESYAARSSRLPCTTTIQTAGSCLPATMSKRPSNVFPPKSCCRYPAVMDLVGVIALGPKRSEAPYSRSDLTLLRSVAAQTGLAIENSHLFSTLAAEAVVRERANREMEIAREVQRRLFPQTSPSVRGVEIAGHCRPALGIGGDYYDFIALDRASDGTAQASSRLGIAIGDVSGKGISAALLMASLRASLRGQTLTGFDLAHLVRNVNLLLYDSSDSNRYATFFFAQYDPATRQLTYVNAGHNAPLSCAPTLRPQALRLALREDDGSAVAMHRSLVLSKPHQTRYQRTEPAKSFVSKKVVPLLDCWLKPVIDNAYSPWSREMS